MGKPKPQSPPSPQGEPTLEPGKPAPVSMTAVPARTTGTAPAGAVERSSVVKLLEAAAKVASVLAAAGYISMRAHFNAFGLSWSASLGGEPYLREIWLLAVWGVDRYALVAACLAALALGARALFGRHRGWMLLAEGLRRGVPAMSSVSFVAGTLALGWALAVRRAAKDVAISLDLDSLNALAALQPVTLDVVIAAGCLAIAAARWARPPVRTVMLALAAVLWLQVPMLYGIIARPRAYPLAYAPKDGHCGLLVMRTDKQIALWHAVGGRGRTETLRQDDFTELRVGELRDLLTEARSAAVSKGSVPDCKPLEVTR